MRKTKKLSSIRKQRDKSQLSSASMKGSRQDTMRSLRDKKSGFNLKPIIIEEMDEAQATPMNR